MEEYKRNLQLISPEIIDDAIIRREYQEVDDEEAPPIFFVSTAHDPRIGIHGAILSPEFKTQKEAVDYLKNLNKYSTWIKKRRT